MSKLTLTEKIFALCRERRLTYAEAAAELGRRGGAKRAARARLIAQRQQLEERKRLT